MYQATNKRSPTKLSKLGLVFFLLLKHVLGRKDSHLKGLKGLANGLSDFLHLAERLFVTHSLSLSLSKNSFYNKH